MSSKDHSRVREKTDTGLHRAPEVERIDNIIKMLNVSRSIAKKRDLATEHIADPQASRAAVERGESPCIPLSKHRQALCNAAEPLTVIETAARILLGELGVDDWVNRN